MKTVRMQPRARSGWSVTFVGCATLALALAPACKSNAIAVNNSNGPDVSDGGTRPTCQASKPSTHATAAEMVLIGLADGKTCYWIDKTEVTRDQYQAFLSDSGSKEQSPACQSTNRTFAPACEDIGGGAGTDDAGGGDAAADAALPDAGPADGGSTLKGPEPMGCVDWCDAWAYCKWAGKTLCAGGDDSKDAKTSRWYSACSEGGRKSYPTATGQSVDGCNVGTRAPTGCLVKPDDCSTVAVASLACTTSDGVSDLAGNVAEWVDECDTSGKCRARGGSIQSDNQGASCKESLTLDRIPTNPVVITNIGFRCCLDAPAGSVVAGDAGGI